MRAFVLFVFLGGLVFGGLACGESKPSPPPSNSGPSAKEVLKRYHVDWSEAERKAAISEGTEAIKKHQCNRCHTIDDVEPAARPKHCTSCHQWLKGLTPDHRTFKKLSSRYGKDVIERYQRNIEHYQQVPDLTGVAARIKPEWIAEFIADPYDLRPALHENMVRTKLSDEDRRAIVRYFAAVAEVADPYAEQSKRKDEPTPSKETMTKGAKLFADRGCNLCHTVGNVPTGKSVKDLRDMGMRGWLAPNLRFSKDRMERDVMVAWIMHPLDIHPTTLMPHLDVSYADAQVLADYLRHVDPKLKKTPEVEALVPPEPIKREVPWEEVKEKVLGRICVHCHMNDYEKDRGPGNEGGFGWPGNHLQMRTYEALRSGAVAKDGTRYSVLMPRAEGGLSPLIEVMMWRRHEERRDRVEPFEDYPRPKHVREEAGMPMGLPSIPDEEVALVRAWIAQGCKGPKAVSGMGGIDDGFLVPDGPIEPNEGCTLRAIPQERPAWATQPPPKWMKPSPKRTKNSPKKQTKE